MRKMHPEIKKFWEEAGWEIENENQELSGTVTATKKIDFAMGIIETIAFGNEHRYNGKWFTEEEMLRIIRMHAFL